MRRQTVGQDKALYELKLEYEYARDSCMRAKHIQQSKAYLDFYYGRQWSDTELKAMRDAEMLPLTINRIEPIINTIVSLQIAGRKNITFKSNSSIPEHQEAADNLKYLMYRMQQENNYHSRATNKFTDALKVGVGYSHFYYDTECEKFVYKDVNFEEVIPDPDDQSQRMDESNRIHRHYFVPLIELIKRYPEHKEFFEEKLKGGISSKVYLTDFYKKGLIDYPDWFVGKSAKIVEVYYKKNVKYYRTLVSLDDPEVVPQDIGNKSQQYFSTFDKEQAEKLKSPEAGIDTMEGTQIWKAVFIEDILLEHGPIVGQIPNQKYFPIVPVCLKRDDNGVPYGEIKSLISLSQSLNRIWTQTLHGLNSRYLFVDAMHDLEKMKQINDILDKRRGVVGVHNPKDIQFFTQENMLPFLFNALRRIDTEFQQITQLYEEVRGEESNATSGIAIKERESNSVRMQNTVSDAYNYMLYSEGQLFLDTVRGLKDFNYSFNYYQNDQTKQVSINSDISLMDFQIYHDTSPVFNSTPEENAAKFAELINSPNVNLLLSRPEFMEELGVEKEKANKFSRAFLEAIQGIPPENPNQQQG